MMTKRIVVILVVCLCSFATSSAQKFFNLTAEDVRIDSVMPYFTYVVPLDNHYSDSIYSVSIVYPEFINMSEADILKYQEITSLQPLAMPVVHQQMVVERKRGSLEVWFVPVVWREGKYKKLVSFMLRVESSPNPVVQAQKNSTSVLQERGAATRSSSDASSRYADHSVLASGKWAKIRIPETGVYQLTESLIKKAGFSSLDKVRIYGYGGELQPEKLTGDYLVATDDLKEVPTCTVGGRRLFHAQGHVSWSSNTATTRTRNPYSDYGYYFITESDMAPLSVDSATFVGSFYPTNADYHVLHEVDNYAWFQGGRNLYEDTPINSGSSKSFTIDLPSHVKSATLTVKLSAEVSGKANVELNGTSLGTISLSRNDNNDRACETTATYNVDNLLPSNTIRVMATSGGPIRPDFFSFCFSEPVSRPDLLKDSFGEPEYVYNITNQDHHADTAVDMVIIVPLSGKLTAQAERLKAFHEQHDSLSVRIVPADELYNEFSSGTPDANAYRRYLKMFYDRAQNDDEVPRYLLLFGDCAWDNRMLSSAWRGLSPDDFLLCYESENSYSDTDCFVSDDYFCMLDDEESIANSSGYYSITGKADVAVGRFPVRNDLQAQILVDKTISYVKNQNAGSWQNTIMVMGDDGNNNLHMRDANEAVKEMEKINGGLVLKRLMWDAYTRETTATGNSYPEITKIIKQQQAEGALIMDYCGHGRADQISHEGVLHLPDFEAFSNTNLPLWITASCDIAPFDGQVDNIGEAAILNEKGGAVVFFGTARTVYADRNKYINIAFLKEVLNTEDEQRVSIGEAQRRAKNSLVDTGTDRTRNKLQYSLLGDPALCLNLPVLKAVVDTINGTSVTATADIQLKAGSVANVRGHIEKQGSLYTGFNGTVSALVRDTEEHIVCKLNDTSSEGASVAFEYDDRLKTLFSGTDVVRDGRFSFSFAVPIDINYTNNTGLINLYAVNEQKNEMANGYCDRFIVGGSQTASNDSIGPSVYCYLNSPSFTNGGNVNSTPYFVAQITDKDGINTSGSSIGHDLELCIDGEMARTYNLNDNFQYDFGSYTSGTTFYAIPQLDEGKHTLWFRAWDILNNSTTTYLDFNVVKGLEPHCFSVACTNNPATTQTTFIVSHDRTGSQLDVEIDVFDFAGRHLWHHAESGVSATGTYTVSWDLTVDSGARLHTGVYLYRVRLSSDGSSKVSKAQKLIILNNN